MIYLMIKKVVLKNYRGFAEASISLPKFAAIVGKNAAGKSNFISAIFLFRRLAMGAVLSDVLSEIAPFGNELFTFSTHRNEAEFEFLIEASEALYRIRFKIGFKRISGSLQIVVDEESLAKMEGNKENAIYKRERDKTYEYDGLEEKEIPIKVEPDRLMLAIYSNEDAQNIVRAILGYTILEAEAEFEKGLRVVIGERPDLKTIDGVAVSLHLKNHGRFDSAVKSIKKVIPSFEPPIIEKLNSPTGEGDKEKELSRYFVNWKDGGHPISRLTLSDGDRRVISLIFNLFNTPENSFMAAEEIENGMHIERLSRLIDEFKTQANNRGIQILFTTHSNEILRCLTVEQVIWCRKDDLRGSRLSILHDTDEYKLIKEDLEGTLNAAEVMESGMFQ